MGPVRCCTDLDKTVLTQNFDKRGWTTVSPDDDWNFYWFVRSINFIRINQKNLLFYVRASVTTVRSIFNPSNDHPRLTDNQ